MATGTRIPKAEVTGVDGAMVKRFGKKSLGEVPAPLGVYWYRAALVSLRGKEAAL